MVQENRRDDAVKTAKVPLCSCKGWPEFIPLLAFMLVCGREFYESASLLYKVLLPTLRFLQFHA